MYSGIQFPLSISTAGHEESVQSTVAAPAPVTNFPAPPARLDSPSPKRRRRTDRLAASPW